MCSRYVIIIISISITIISKFLVLNNNLFNLGVRCFDTPEGYRCGQCPPGQTGDGVTCDNMDNCHPNPCFPGVQCGNINQPPYYRCGDCPPGLTGNGTICVDIDEVSMI